MYKLKQKLKGALKMKLFLEIPVPEYEWIETPILYDTPIGEFGLESEVSAIKSLFEYLQRLPERHVLIESDHQHFRHPFCRELVRNRLPFIPEQNIWHVAEKLSFFLMEFQESSGLNFDEYKFSYSVLSNGKKVKFKKFNKLFDSEHDLFIHAAKIYTSSQNFDFTIAKT